MAARALAVRAAVVAAAGLSAAVAAPALGLPGSRPWSAVAGLVAGLLAVLAEGRLRRGRSLPRSAGPAYRTGPAGGPPTILDTSVIIDGRIAGVGEAGFLETPVVVPEFVLGELRQMGDSPDALRRRRAARGLEVLARLERLPGLAFSVDGRDFPDVAAVDDKVIALARATGGRIATNDAGLLRRARLDGVRVLSVNELADAVKPAVLSGEPMTVRVVKAGREAGQGVAYLDDGTMVVIDGGRAFVGRALDVTVTSVRQTRVGRMIFARPRVEEAVPR